MTPVRHKIPALVGEAAVSEHSCSNVRFWPDTKNMNAARRLPSCLVPIDFSIVGATVEANGNDGECR